MPECSYGGRLCKESVSFFIGVGLVLFHYVPKSLISTGRAHAGRAHEDYNNKEYWDSRYRTAGMAGDGLDGPKSSTIYEWYLSFDEYSALLLSELKSYEDREYDNNGVLVTGCGNSTLCEDLYNRGGVNLRDAS
jgi:hypothetical protein